MRVSYIILPFVWFVCAGTVRLSMNSTSVGVYCIGTLVVTSVYSNDTTSLKVFTLMAPWAHH